jgi:hypothetical protein
LNWDDYSLTHPLLPSLCAGRGKSPVYRDQGRVIQIMKISLIHAKYKSDNNLIEDKK